MKMADYGGAISLSQTRTSDDSSSEHSPPTRFTTPSTAGFRAATTPTKSKIGKTFLFDQTLPETAPRKPRGRPPGSKNKPKPPIVITRDDSDCALKPVILEIAAGCDIVETIVSFAKRNHSGVSIISATGTVSNVTLRHPISHSPAFSLHGPFGLLALSGSFLGSSSKQTVSSSSCFGVTLAGGQGQVFGGIVGGKVTAETTVVVVAATFKSPAVHRLPAASEGDVEAEQEESKPCVGGGASEGCSSAGVYGVASPNPISCQIPPDVMPWRPTPRPY